MIRTALTTAIAVVTLTQPVLAATKHACHDGTYWSRSYGQCIARPYKQIAICKDGSSSVSAWVKGACRGHGGVDHIQHLKPTS